MEILPTKEFLKKIGFASGNPFSDTQAEEEDNLSKYFVDLPAFYKTMDMDTGRPRSSILGADRGCGKSANRKNVERWLLQGPFEKSITGKWPWKRPILVVPYTDFSRLRSLVNDNLNNIRPDHHVISILWVCTSSLIEYIEKNWKNLDFSSISDWNIAQLGYYINNYSERWGGIKKQTNKKPMKLNEYTGSPKEFFQYASSQAFQAEKIALSGYGGLLKGFVDISLAFGLHNVVVLVDGVDEIDVTANDPKLGATLLKSLIAERILMQTSGVIFKFFLPTKIIHYLKNIPEIRFNERIKYNEIEWSKNAIQDLLSQRLRAFSENKIRDFAQLAHEDSKQIGYILANHSNNNPRNLLRLAEQVLIKLEEHQANLNSKDRNRMPRITKSVLNQAIEFYDKNIVVRDFYFPEKSTEINSIKNNWNITPDLHVIYKGNIITKNKLNPKEYQILMCFLEHPEERLDREEIGKLVWKNKWANRYGWVLTQRISTLRKKIGDERIETVRGLGYIFHGD